MKIYKLNNDFNYSNIELSQPKGVQGGKFLYYKNNI